jgi:DNA-binding IclR family transcriptional regulator
MRTTGLADKRHRTSELKARNDNAAVLPLPSVQDALAESPTLRRGLGMVEPAELPDIGRKFVNGLARGLEVLNAFRRGDPPLGNQELAERTGIPKPTVSRLAYTLTQLGYLSYNTKTSTYELGGAALSLGYVAQSNPDVRYTSRPILQKLAAAGIATVGLGIRDRSKMLYVDVYDGQGLVGLRISAGSHIPFSTTAFGHAYLAALPDHEFAYAMDELAKSERADWSMLKASIEESIRQIADRGFCVVDGAWLDGVSGVGAPIFRPEGMMPYAINAGGPPYLLPTDALNDVYGPAVAAAAKTITGLLGGKLT